MSLQETMCRPIVNLDTIKDYLVGLSRAGWIAPLQQSDRKAGSKFDAIYFRQARDSFEVPRVRRSGRRVEQGTQTLAMWRAVKVLREFDFHDVRRAASLTASCQVTAHTAKRYVELLGRAGYFRVVQLGRPGTPKRYRLVRDTGARPPAITKDKSVFDRNTGEFFWQSVPRASAANE